MSNAIIGWNFWRKWVLACTIGGTVGLFVCGCILVAARGAVVGKVIGWAIVGFFLGVAQYVVLRQHLTRANRWILASVVGVLISSATAELLFPVVGVDISWAVAGAIGAIMQYLVLQQQVFRANRWVLVNAAGVGIGVAIGRAVAMAVASAVTGPTSMPDKLQSPLSEAADGIAAIVGILLGSTVGVPLGCAIYGAITGGVLVWLLRHPRVVNQS